MADLRQHEALVEQVAKARKESSRRPDIKFPIGKLNQIGRHVYAYGPQITNTTSDKVLLEFNTQSEYIKGIMQLCGSIVAATVAAGNISNWHVNFNDMVIARFKTETQEEDSPTTLSIPLIVPPFTNVKVYAIDNDTNGQISAYFTGEAYA